MKALIQKELRENLKLAVLGLVIFSAILALNILTYSLWMESVAAGANGQREVRMMQPLVSEGFWMFSGYFCAIFGAVLGWFQIHNERQRDLWTFLVHRPVTRTQIFFGKIFAGLVLYVLVTGLPLTGYLIWALTLGHIAAPFEWAMLRPVAVLSISGIAYYFAGMLTGLRQARWYASRALGLGMAILVSMTVISVLHFWQALAAILIGSGVLATAVWGGFHSNGYYRGQPAPGRLALVASLVPGCALVLVVAAVLLIQLLSRNHAPQLSYYRMNKDGAIYKITPNKEGWPPEIADLEGKPLVDPKTGSAPKWAEFDQRKCYENEIPPIFDDRANNYDPWFFNSCSRFTFWRETADSFWFYCNRHGRLAGYDKKTRQFIGSLGPDGYSKDLRGNGDHFDRVGYYEPLEGVVLHDARTVYQPDPEHHAVKALFTVTNENCEAVMLATNRSNRIIGAVHEVWINGYDWDYTIVVTRCFVHLLAPDGKEIWRAAYQPAYPEYNQVTVACLESNNQFAVWIGPSWLAQQKSGGKLPTHVTWLDRHGSVLKSADLPDLSYRPLKISREQKLVSMTAPPIFFVIFPLLRGQHWAAGVPWVLFRFSLMTALVCLPVSWWLGRRYSLSLRSRLGWAAFCLVFGIAGLLTQLCVEEWPAREICPGCKGLRVVDREKCPHCGADFAPPDKTGTEIFAPLKMADAKT
jgi:ABC-type transport system involved in multi-copper enzyme maturation permease subunit